MRIVVAPYGPAAFEALTDAIVEHRGADPMRRATVVVPRGAVGLAVRRRLAARDGGVIGVRFLTVAAFAAELAAGWVADTGRTPVTRAAVHEAARRALAIADGPLSAVREQPATVRALVRTFGDLRELPTGSLGALGRQGELSREVVRLVRTVADRLSDRYDETDLGAAATAVVRSGTVPSETGSVVVYLPTRLGPVPRALLGALSEVVPVTVIVGSTGDPTADVLASDLVRGLGGLPDERGFGGAVQVGTKVIVAPTADAEVLLVLRQLMAANAAGVRLERMAVAHCGNAPYPRLLHDELLRAGIPFNGTGVRPLSATVAGRTLLGALALGDRDWRRDDVVAWLNSGPLLDGGRRRVPGVAWDELSVRAGVVSGLSEWRERVGAHAAELRERAEPGSEAITPFVRQAERCDWLVRFVEETAERLAEPGGSWAERSAWAKRFLGALLGGPTQTAGWPAAEVSAYEAVLDAVGELASLGRVEPTTAEFRAALAAELEAPAPQVSRFGHGVFVGRVAEVVGLDLDVLFVVGMVDGALSGPAADDVLIPDRLRAAVGDEIPLRGARPAADRRDFLAALASAPLSRVLSFATGDQRNGRVQRPDRLLLDTAGAVAAAGRRVFAGDLANLAASEAFEHVQSFTAAVAAGDGEPASEADWNRRSLLHWVMQGGNPSRHHLAAEDRTLRLGLVAQAGRRGRAFTRFDGRIDSVAVPSPAQDAVQSATGLESFARCPRSYLFSKLLRIEVLDPPEEMERVTPLVRGTIFHRVLERFLAAELARGPIDPATSWDADAESRLAVVADEVFSEFEHRGLTGLAVLWRLDRAALLGELQHFLREDDRHRREGGAVPVAVEEGFGRDDSPPVSVPLEGGGEVRFRGSIDRIDRTADDGLTVLDYKTGVRHPIGDDPVAGGTRLQLPIYARAARRRFPAAGPVEAAYWYVGDRGNDRGRYPKEGFAVTPDGDARFEEVVGTLVASIDGGRFPGRPGACTFCPYDGVCPSDREQAWERKRADSWIDDYRELAEPS